MDKSEASLKLVQVAKMVAGTQDILVDINKDKIWSIAGIRRGLPSWQNTLPDGLQINDKSFEPRFMLIEEKNAYRGSYGHFLKS